MVKYECYIINSHAIVRLFVLNINILFNLLIKEYLILILISILVLTKIYNELKGMVVV